jgi:hypothetical protein
VDASPPFGVAGQMGRPALTKGLQMPGEDDPSREVRPDHAADIFRGNHLQVDRIWFSYVLRVTVTWENPFKAQRLVAAFTERYPATQREARQEAL